MEELIKMLAPLGVGGVLAAFIFYFYRQDRKDSEKRYGDITSAFKSALQGNTAVLTEVVVMLRNGREP